MAIEDEAYLGIVQYQGKSTLLQQGYLDAKTTAQALAGLDEALRYFIGAQSPQLRGSDFDIPVSVRAGSVRIILPDSALFYSLTAFIGAAAGTYLKAGIQEMAKNDFSDSSLRDQVHKALKGIQWALRIGKRRGTTSHEPQTNVRWRHNNQEVGLPDRFGDCLYVPVEFYKLYEFMPPDLLAKLASVVTEDRHLDVIVRDGDDEATESLSADDKHIFCPEEVDDILFPELLHGDQFEAVGKVTRGNERTNSVGFDYKGHILNCSPKAGDVVRFKDAMFGKAHIQGTIDRRDDSGLFTERKPKIIFTKLEAAEVAASVKSDYQAELFGGDTGNPTP